MYTPVRAELTSMPSGTMSGCSLAEALALRAAGIDAPILAWLDPRDIDLTASSLAELDLIVDGSRPRRDPGATTIQVWHNACR